MKLYVGLSFDSWALPLGLAYSWKYGEISIQILCLNVALYRENL